MTREKLLALANFIGKVGLYIAFAVLALQMLLIGIAIISRIITQG